MPPLPGPERETVNSRFNQVLAIGIWTISAVIAVSLFFIDRPSQLAYLVPMAFVNLGHQCEWWCSSKIRNEVW